MHGQLNSWGIEMVSYESVPMCFGHINEDNIICSSMCKFVKECRGRAWDNEDYELDEFKRKRARENKNI
jgi:hypothetical protein